MSQRTLKQHQTSMAQYLRDPLNTSAPKELDERRVSIYSELVFNNIESQLSASFPVISSILSKENWYSIIREFIRDYRAQTPYFTQLSAEFVTFIANRTLAGTENKAEYDFLLELAHYERVELDLYMMDEDHERASIKEADLLTTPISLASTTQLLAYAYPVHQISTDFLPREAPTQPTFLLLFQDQEQEVRFFELQPLAYRLVEKLSQADSINGLTLLNEIAQEMNLEMNHIFIHHGKNLLAQLNSLQIFVSTTPNSLANSLSNKGDIS